LKYEEELKTIRRLRKDVYKLNMPIILMLILGIITSYLIPIVAPLFGILAFLFFYKKLLYVANYPCPKCGSPFYTQTKIILGVDAQACQKCGIEIKGE